MHFFRPFALLLSLLLLQGAWAEESPAPCTADEDFSRSGEAPCTPCQDCTNHGGTWWNCFPDSNSVCRDSAECVDGSSFSTTGYEPCTPCSICETQEIGACTTSSDTLCTPLPSPTTSPPPTTPAPAPEAADCDCVASGFWPACGGNGLNILLEAGRICDQEAIVAGVPGVRESCCDMATILANDPCHISFFYWYAPDEIQRITFLGLLCGLDIVLPCKQSYTNGIWESQWNADEFDGIKDGAGPEFWADCIHADNKTDEHDPDVPICPDESTCFDLTQNGDETDIDMGGSCPFPSPEEEETESPEPEPEPSTEPPTEAPTPEPSPSVPGSGLSVVVADEESELTDQELAVGIVGLLIGVVCLAGLGWFMFCHTTVGTDRPDKKGIISSSSRRSDTTASNRASTTATRQTQITTGASVTLSPAPAALPSPAPSAQTSSGAAAVAASNEGLPPDWSRQTTEDGQVYYWNAKTMHSTWTQPT